MKLHVWIAGGTGVLGRRIVPRLLALGHRVTVMARDPQRAAALHAQGATIVVGDALDARSVERALAGDAHDVVMHQLTDLAAGSFAANARLRVEGTRNLVTAAVAAGVRRIIVQSIAWCYEPGDAPADEATPLDAQSTDEARRRSVDAVIAMERCASELPDAVILRNGLLYGPDTWYAPAGTTAERARAGQLPATPDLASFVYIDDAAAAAVLALSWPAGPVNIIDDAPAPGSQWVPAFCAAVSAPPPATPAVARTPHARGALNQLARARGWTLAWPSWRAGFAAWRD